MTSNTLACCHSEERPPATLCEALRAGSDVGIYQKCVLRQIATLPRVLGVARNDSGVGVVLNSDYCILPNMLGYLSGTIKSKELNSLIVDVNGVGYQVFTPLFVWQNCQIGAKKELLIYTHVRESEISLFGFLEAPNKEIFVNLLSVSGIGPRLALNIISYSRGSRNIIHAIQEADVDFFTSIKGVGKKSGQRIIVDLKSKIGGLKDLEFETEQDHDLLEALKGLGFSREEIKKSVKGIKKDLSLEEKIRLALKKSK